MEARNHDDLPPANGSRLETVEQRVHRLEDAVAALQDTRQLEERLVERVSDRIRRESPVAQAPPGLLVEARRTLLPKAIEWVRGPNDVPAGEPKPAHQGWLVFDALIEARVIFTMFFDPRYRMGWGVRGLTLGLLAFILVSSWIIPGTGLPIVGTILTKAIDLTLAFFLYKVLTRESRRYRATFPELFPPRV